MIYNCSDAITNDKEIKVERHGLILTYSDLKCTIYQTKNVHGQMKKGSKQMRKVVGQMKKGFFYLQYGFREIKNKCSKQHINNKQLK